MAFLDFEFFSACTSKLVHGKAIIPTGNQVSPNAAPPYRTLYMLTGFADTANRIATDSDIRAMAESRGIAVIILDGENSFYVDRNPLCQYSRLVGEELVRVTRDLFPLSHKREDTYITGMSMGGFGSLYNGVRFADTFSKVAMLCPACDVYDINAPGMDIPLIDWAFLDGIFGSRAAYDQDFKPVSVVKKAVASGKRCPELFLGLGDTDDLVGPGVQEFLKEMEQIQIPVEYHMVPGYHDFVFMNNIYPYLFDFLNK